MKELKRVLIIGPVYPYKGGIAHYTGLMSMAFTKAGYEVETISYSVQYPKLLMRKEQKDYSNKTFAIPDTKYLIHTANPFGYGKAAKEILALAPDLVIAQWWHPYFAPCYQSVLGKVAKKVPVIFLCHNVLPHERFPFDRLLTKNTLRLGKCVVQSKEDEKDLLALFPKKIYRKALHPTYSAFCMRGLNRDEARRELQIMPEEKILLFFGFVRQYKGLNYLLEAMPKVLNKYPELKLYVVGDFGKAKEEYLDKMQTLGIREAVVIRDGYVPDGEVEPYFAAADLCVCPYVSATQSGIVQISFGSKLPVLATNVGGLPEAVTDQETGLIVEAENSDALADGIIRYYEEQLQATFRENIEKQQEKFSWERMVDTIVELYQA